MQHANLVRIEGAADGFDRSFRHDVLAQIRSRSARTEMIMRELAKLQAQAAQLAAAIEANEDIAGPGQFAAEPCSSATIKQILGARLERNSYFPGDLFSDPAWDMLLELYAAELGQVRVSVTGLCIASNAPTSTALRWISVLERKKLIERRPDPLDGRRFFLSLTRDAVERCQRYFSAHDRRSAI
jgi:DNA-binding MarR family transcriptional regulator